MKLAIRFVLLTCAIVAAQGRGYGQCVSANFTESLGPDNSLGRELGNGLRLHLTNTKGGLGWVVSVNPKESPAEDWTFPVNFPLRNGDRQSLATGYGETVKERLTYTHTIRFALDKSDYDQYRRMADDALESTDPNAGSAYMTEYRKMRTGTVLITPLRSETSDDGRQIRRAKLRFTIIVPERFPVSPDLQWHPAECPKAN